jgi:hypothetical protein
MRTGEINRRADVPGLSVAVLSNAMHLSAGPGRVIVCPFIEGAVADADMVGVVGVEQPDGTLLPELVHWLPTVALESRPIGRTSAGQVRAAVRLTVALLN